MSLCPHMSVHKWLRSSIPVRSLDLLLSLPVATVHAQQTSSVFGTYLIQPVLPKLVGIAPGPRLGSNGLL